MLWSVGTHLCQPMWCFINKQWKYTNLTNIKIHLPHMHRTPYWGSIVYISFPMWCVVGYRKGGFVNLWDWSLGRRRHNHSVVNAWGRDLKSLSTHPRHDTSYGKADISMLYICEHDPCTYHYDDIQWLTSSAIHDFCLFIAQVYVW